MFKMRFIFTLERLFLLIILFVFSSCNKKSNISSNTIKFNYDKSGIITLVVVSDSSYFLVDTGSSHSVIYSDRLEVSSVFRGLVLFNKRRIECLRKVDSINVKGIIVKNHTFLFLDSRKLFQYLNPKELGIIGMDILSQKFCYFDKKNKTLTLSDKRGQTDSADLILAYRPSCIDGCPYIDLYLNGKLAKNVLFDTGHTGFLTISKKDVPIDDPVVLEVGSMPDILGRVDTVQLIKLDSISINDISFTNPFVLISKRHRFLGMQFVTCFSSFLIDPFNKTIEFYI